MRNVLLTFSFLACTALVLLAQSADALLSQTFKAYQSLFGLRVRSTIVVEQKMGKMAMKQTVEHEAAYQRPNLLRVRWTEEGGQGEITIVSDGKNLFTQIDALKQVKKEAAPKTLKEIVRSKNQPSMVVDDLSCFIGENWKGKVTAAKVIGKENLNERDTTKVLLSLKDGSTQTLWVDKTGLIWRSVRQVQQKHPSGQMLTITITETFQEIKTDPKLPKNFFAYKLPKDFKQVDEFQVPQTQPKQQR